MTAEDEGGGIAQNKQKIFVEQAQFSLHIDSRQTVSRQNRNCQNS